MLKEVLTRLLIVVGLIAFSVIRALANILGRR